MQGLLNIGAWRVDAASNEISRDGEVVRVDARLMRLLTCLAARAGEVVTTEELLAEVWGSVVVTQDSVYQAVASLRKVLGDEVRKPAYIVTVPRRGYRLIAAVGLVAVGDGVAAGAATTREAAMPTRWRVAVVLAIGGVLCLAQAASVAPEADPAVSHAEVTPPRSVAVLPFLDLTTESMDQEFFADGLTEELIDDLSRDSDLKVPSATAAFYFKGKRITVTNIARQLGVTYVVDGSLRRSGSTLRIAARLVRADSGFVVWSQTYDRDSDDVLKVQSDVAAQVTKELQAKLARIAPSVP